MIGDESETKTEWIGGKEQVRESEKKRGHAGEEQRERKQQVNSNVIAIRSI